MTISTTATSVAFTGNGVTTAFPVPFAFFGTGASAELEVIERTIATGAETVKTVTTHYTVSGGNGSTGTVNALSAPASTVEWHIRRKTTKTQATDYVPNDPFPAASHEAALDRVVAQVQEVAGDMQARVPKLPRTWGGDSLDMAEPETGHALIWNTAADGLINTPLPLDDYLDTVSLYADEAGEYADEAGGYASAAAASAASASAHDAAAAASAASASGYAAAAASAQSAILGLSMSDKISAFEVVRNNASAVEINMHNEVSAFAVVAAAISADQVLIANDKSAVGVMSLAVGSLEDVVGGYSLDVADDRSVVEVLKNQVSGYEDTVAAYVASASAHETAAAGSASLAGGHASDAAASATQAANAVGGLTFIFDDGTSAADPGDGQFRLNNATPGSATALYIDNEDDQGGDVTGWLDAWATSTNTQKGILLLKGLDEPLAFLMAYVTAVADSTGYRTVTIQALASGGSFILGDRFLAIFAPAGNKGADGLGAGDVLGAGNGSAGGFAQWVDDTTLTVGTIDAADVVDFGTATDARIAAAEATKGDIFLMSGGDILTPRAVQSANDIVTVTPASGVATLNLSAGRNFRWPINNNATLVLAGEKAGMAGLLEIVKTTGNEAVTFLTAFDAANVTLPTTTAADYVCGYYVLSAGDVIVLPGGPHV